MDSHQLAQLDRYIEQLFNDYQPRLFNYAFKRIGNKEEAEDLVLEAFEKLYTHLRKPDKQIREPLSYLYGIIRNSSIDLFNDEERKVTVSLNSLQERRTDEEQITETLEPTDTSPYYQPEVVVESKEGMRRITEEIEALPNIEMQKTLQAHIIGLSNTEISAHLQQPDGTTRGYISRARTLLRNRLKPL